jgi:hypothetical protein
MKRVLIAFVIAIALVGGCMNQDNSGPAGPGEIYRDTSTPTSTPTPCPTQVPYPSPTAFATPGGSICAAGEAVAPCWVTDPGQAELMAQSAAVADSRQNLYEAVEALALTNGNTLYDEMIASEALRADVELVVNSSFREADPVSGEDYYVMPNGVYRVVSCMTLSWLESMISGYGLSLL